MLSWTKRRLNAWRILPVSATSTSGAVELVDAERRIDAQLTGSVEEAWTSCLLTWRELGRVNDLSRAFRVPKYFPSYATQLGRAFADKFHDQMQFLASILRIFAFDTTEYLCAYDLLEFIVGRILPDELSLVDELFKINCELPPVIQCEIRGLSEYDGLDDATVGPVLRRRYQCDWEL